MTTTLENQILYVQIAPTLATADAVLASLRSRGIQVRRWSVTSAEESGRSRLIVEYDGDRGTVMELLGGLDGVIGFEIPVAETSVQVELALVRVRATGKPLDEAAEIVGAAGGRLLSLTDGSFSAQVSSRPERIEAMLARLRRTADIEVVRSGSLSVQK